MQKYVQINEGTGIIECTNTTFKSNASSTRKSKKPPIAKFQQNEKSFRWKRAGPIINGYRIHDKLQHSIIKIESNNKIWKLHDKIWKLHDKIWKLHDKRLFPW